MTPPRKSQQQISQNTTAQSGTVTAQTAQGGGRSGTPTRAREAAGTARKLCLGGSPTLKNTGHRAESRHPVREEKTDLSKGEKSEPTIEKQKTRQLSQVSRADAGRQRCILLVLEENGDL
jgi:hypothetical protein